MFSLDNLLTSILLQGLYFESKFGGLKRFWLEAQSTHGE